LIGAFLFSPYPPSFPLSLPPPFFTCKRSV